jgi:aminotransferase
MPADLISERERELPLSTMAKLIKIAEERKDVISLGPGEPDFDSPEHIVKAARRSLAKGYTHYSPPVGREDLRELIARKLKKENRIDVGIEQIIVTTGSTEGILMSLMCTIDPGEGVMLTDPAFLSYKPTVEMLNGMPVSVPLFEKDGFQLKVEKMEELIIPEKTRVLILNTPMNPTGIVFSRKVLEEIADFAVEYELMIVSDEAYEKLVYGVKHVSIGSLNGMEERVVTLHSFSKTYAMPGFRIGYAAGPEELIKAMTKTHVYTTLCAPTISQMAAIEALKGSQRCVGRMVREYDRRRKFIFKRVKDIGLSCVEPGGAFYIFPNIKEFGMKSLEFSRKLLKEAGVAVVPGTEFGRHGEGFVRLSYATEMKKIRKAMERIEGFVEELRKRG